MSNPRIETLKRLKDYITRERRLRIYLYGRSDSSEKTYLKKLRDAETCAQLFQDEFAQWKSMAFEFEVFELCCHAIQEGNKVVVQTIIDAGLCFGGQNEDGHTPLLQAIKCCEVEIVELLLTDRAIALMHYPGIYESDEWKERHKNKRTNTLEAHVNARTKKLETPLIHTAAFSHPTYFKRMTEIACQLIQKGADVNAVDKFGNALMHALDNKGYYRRYNRYNKELIYLLIISGTDLTATTSKKEGRNTALHLAALSEQFDSVVYLVGRGAKTDAKNKNRRTPRDLIVDDVNKRHSIECIASL